MNQRDFERMNEKALRGPVGGGNRKVDALVRCCGGCFHFDSEDISGGGWCNAADHATACGDDCPKWHQDFYTPMVGQVASISLPVGVKELAGMVDDLEKKHGKGLVMRKIGNALIISQSNDGSEFPGDKA